MLFSALVRPPEGKLLAEGTVGSSAVSPVLGQSRTHRRHAIHHHFLPSIQPTTLSGPDGASANLKLLCPSFCHPFQHQLNSSCGSPWPFLHFSALAMHPAGGRGRPRPISDSWCHASMGPLLLPGNPFTHLPLLLPNWSPDITPNPVSADPLTPPWRPVKSPPPPPSLLLCQTGLSLFPLELLPSQWWDPCLTSLAAQS